MKAGFSEAAARYGKDAGEMTVCKVIEDDAGLDLRVAWVAMGGGGPGLPTPPERSRLDFIRNRLVPCLSGPRRLVCGRSQGGVQFPTGGMRRKPRARERLPEGRVSRPGAMPGPTVTVRMKENVRFRMAACRRNSRDRLG